MSAQAEVDAFLRGCVLTRREVDRFLDPAYPKWARFDSVLGHLPHPCVIPDGADGSLSTYSYEPDLARRMVNGRGVPCRVATYGDSFTQGVQVSDGQTWQEQLAAHIGEPIRNFGVGGYGVYQAIRRLRDIELGGHGRPYLVLNVYWPDHHRSIDAYRLARLGMSWREHDLASTTSMFHGNPWEHLRLDPPGEHIEVRPNVCPQPEDLYRLCDPDFVLETFRDDFVLQLVVAVTGQLGDFADRHRDLARTLGVEIDTSDTSSGGAHGLLALYDAYAQRTSLLLLRELQAQVARSGQSLLILLSYPSETVEEYCRAEYRPDALFIEGLAELGLPYVDTLASHRADFAAFALQPDAYVDRYYSGHYNPSGNQFFALAVREAMCAWLDPPPPAYRTAESAPSPDVTAAR